jgi:hypothetical protein
MVWGGGFFSSSWDGIWAEEDRKGVFGGGEEGGWCEEWARSG